MFLEVLDEIFTERLKNIIKNA